MNIKRINVVFDSSILFFLYVLIFWIPYSPAVIEVCVCISLLLYILKKSLKCWFDLRDGDMVSCWHIYPIIVRCFRPCKNVLDKPILCFLCIAFLSSCLGGFPGMSLSKFLTKTMEWFVIYYLFLEVFTEKKHFKIAMVVFLVTGCSTVFDGLLQYYILGKDIFYGTLVKEGEATAGFKHANTLAGYYSIFIPVLFSLCFSKKYKIFYVIMLVLSCLSLMTTFSRMGWVAIFLACILCFLCQKGKKYGKFIMLMFCILSTLYCIIPQQKLSDFKMDKSSFVGAMEWRIGIWEDSFKLIKEKPILGHGINTFMPELMKHRRKSNVFYDHVLSYAHNCFIQVFAELGLLGLLGFLWICGVLLKMCWAGICLVKKCDNLSCFYIGLYFGLIGFLIHSCFDVHFYSLQLTTYFWSSAGLLMAFILFMQNEKKEICG